MPYGGYQQPHVPIHPTMYGDVELASWGRRAGGYLIDILVIWLLFLVCLLVGVGIAVGGGMAVDPAGLNSDSPPLVFIVLLILAYVGAFAGIFCYRWLPHANSGRTLGKRAVGIRLVKADTGQPVGKGASFGRELVFHLLSFATCGIGSLIDLLWPLWDDKNQTLHDKAVNGVVIVQRST